MSTRHAKAWAIKELKDSATTIPVIDLNFCSLHNAGLCEKKIVALLNIKGIYARSTGVCGSVELRPSSGETSNPHTWAEHVANVVMDNWVSLRRDV